MHTVVAERLFHCVALIGERFVVVHIEQIPLSGKTTHPLVELDNMLRRLLYRGSPRKLPRGRYRAKDYPDLIRGGQINHGGDVALDCLECRRAAIAADIVSAPENVHNCRFQCDDILSESHEHLRRRLPGNAPVYVVFTKNLRMGGLPELGTG